MLLDFFLKYYTLFFVWLTCFAALLTVGKVSRLRWFLLYLVVMALAETAGNFLAYKSVKNHAYFNLFYLVQFAAIPLLFLNQLRAGFFKKAIRVYFVFFPLFVAADILWLQNFGDLLTHVFVAGGGFVLLLSLGYFWQLYTSDETESIWHYPVFWFSLAYVFYYAVALPYIGMLNYLWLQHPGFTRNYYLVFMLAIILHNLFLTTGILCLRRTAAKP